MRPSTQVKKQLDSLKTAFEDFKNLDFRIFEHMPIGICLTDENGIFTDVNSAYLDTYGYTRDELIGESFTKVVPVLDQKDLKKTHKKFFNKDQKRAEIFTVRNKHGEEFEIFAHSTRIDIDDEKWRLMSFIAPIDELPETVERMTSSLVLMEKKITAQNNAADLSDHQMRNSIGSIITVATMLKKSSLDEMQTKWVEFIERAGHRTLGILETTKDFVQMEMGEFKPKYEDLDIVSTVSKLKEQLKDLTAAKQNRIRLTVEGKEAQKPTVVNVKADETYVNHLLNNLITNAVEAAPDGSTVGIDVSSADLLEIRIKNEGMVPEHVQKRFFDKYVSSGKEKGTGLGTYIARLIAQSHKGDITFETDQEQGTELTVTLPFTVAEMN
ncbi:PAS domain-containing sensor histidine kinase [Nonlabens ponticola]|uniref:PAS domain-containing sensor histidine kinase n=1 Tax=Nonlabens ponticola TaxID=2496866 RepID=A0A3S9N0G5_9FLAO|nr:PAS domain-containing sensor histidine kinase [Nonlabens ponticola]AZQ44803.1 PAS domain-containing sensor histidine kinase [Nonlabens ponticola]